MDIIVLLRMVPDVAEELAITPDGKNLDEEWLRMKLSESDEHAVEEAVILKEKYGGNVTVAALDAPEVDDAFFNALAKGADRAVKIVGEWKNFSSPSISKVFSRFLTENCTIGSHTLILSGSQAIDDLEGEMIHYLAGEMNLQENSIITCVNVDASQKNVTYVKEFAGGLRGEFEVALPTVLGIQAAENPPRYIPIAKIRAMMKTAQIEEIEIAQEGLLEKLSVDRLYVPEISGKAEMLVGEPAEVSSRIIDIFSEKGII